MAASSPNIRTGSRPDWSGRNQRCILAAVSPCQLRNWAPTNWSIDRPYLSMGTRVRIERGGDRQGTYQLRNWAPRG